MAHRVISQIVLVGSRVVGRAVVEAWKQAQAMQKHAKATAAAGGVAATSVRGQISLDEAFKVLDVKATSGKEVDLENVAARYKRLFANNDPKKGGSFYLQSKIHRARERIEAEARRAGREVKVEEPAAAEGAAKEAEKK